MSLRLAGLGWVTPLGSGIDEVWAKLLAGSSAEISSLGDFSGRRNYSAFKVPPEAIAEAAKYPRLRRSSAISRFAVLAGVAALRDAGFAFDEASAARTALVFAISNGGVIYTKRFFHEIVNTGPQAASPLLFPETVFNAPASHLAAILGITGASYTLVGDGAVGILALQMALDLMANPQLERCVVVGAEEADWLLCDAYRRWRLLRSSPPVEPFAQPPRGMILSEGAGAVVLTREGGGVQLDRVNPGANFSRQRELVRQLDRICGAINNGGGGAPDVLIASANGTFIDAAEEAVWREYFPEANLYTPKQALGESVAAGALWQTICAARALREQRLPPALHGPARLSLTSKGAAVDKKWGRALVTSCGLNQQVAALLLSSGAG